MCYGQQCCVYGKKREREISMARLLLYCVKRCKLVLGVVCVTVSNDVFMEGTDRECSVASLMLYCVTVCILVFGF